MASEKNFETRVKNWLESIGVYPLGVPPDEMTVEPVGYWEKRWGGGMFVKTGLPDMHIVVGGINLDVELKSSTGTASDLQKITVRQINNSGSIALILYPEGFPAFKEIVKGVLECNSVIPALKRLKGAHASTKCVILTN